jgi:hypothetical protein
MFVKTRIHYLSPAVQMIDTSIVRVHQHGACILQLNDNLETTAFCIQVPLAGAKAASIPRAPVVSS